MTMPGDLVRDFAKRTRQNLVFIEQHVNDSNHTVYEVTQLINSMLGLLIFPRERFINSIPSIPLDELHKRGWPDIRMEGSASCRDLNQIVRLLRNGVAHCNVEFLPDDRGEIGGIHIWNKNRGIKDWEAWLALEELRAITDIFGEMLESGELEGRGQAR